MRNHRPARFGVCKYLLPQRTNDFGSIETRVEGTVGAATVNRMLLPPRLPARSKA
jgi:hypothetical protein